MIYLIYLIVPMLVVTSFDNKPSSIAHLDLISVVEEAKSKRLYIEPLSNKQFILEGVNTNEG